ncbi:vWA domain-containing protein [Raineyella sp. W15-4]|uniref:vWA domain-containing protein n=1 Tax=Raineyella sp. W15-4 TaxID=3081651 RepID=UPI002952F5AE|nr:vWA domain-containing protein [Raineyella sp. W15-4]WOQ17305.1 vWA domain-containing protein [Raineyella sp. W15-4]
MSEPWVRREFGDAGLTQYPPGPALEAWAARFSGTVILCIDCSGSMFGAPLADAKEGAREFVATGLAENYSVGIVFWNSRVECLHEPSRARKSLEEFLSKGQASGGNDLIPCLEHVHSVLGPLEGDRVCAIFGDGDISPESAVLTKVGLMKAEGIRFVTRGLGSWSDQQFQKLETGSPTGPSPSAGSRVIYESAGEAVRSMSAALTAVRRRTQT